MLAPSTSAASSTSLGTFMKNWRRKKIANGVMNSDGSMIPRRLSMRPSCFTSRKFGSSVKITGTIRDSRKKPKTKSRPRQTSRENA